MRHPILRTLARCAALTVASAAMAQTAPLAGRATIPAGSDWQAAQSFVPRGTILVVSVDRPDRLQTCHIRSFTSVSLVCSRAAVGRHTYLPQQVVALVLPGEDATRIRLFLGFNAGLGAALWGTVVLVPICPGCAAATGIAAYFCFGAAGVTAYADGQVRRLFYLAPGQTLSHKLGYIEQ